MQSNTLDDFTQYVENLCRKHVEIKHSDDDCHFLQLNDDQQFQELKNITFPMVTLDKLTVSYTGSEDSTRKSRYCELMFLDKAGAGDFVEIQEVKNRMERVAEDFVKKMKADRKQRTLYPFLKTLVLSGVEFNFVENKAHGLYGGLLSFNFDLPFVDQLEAGRFDD